MKKMTSIGMALSVYCVTLSPALAMTMAPTMQPNDGFIQTENPEWSASHADSTSNAPGHRQYHQEAEATLLRWYSNNASEKGTATYTRNRRAMLQARNMFHRQRHARFNFNTSTSSTSVRGGTSSTKSTSSSSTPSSSSSTSIPSSSSSSSVVSTSSSSMSSSSVANASQSSVALGAASTFSVLAGSTVTNTGQTTVIGDLGVSPGSAVTGFGPGVVSGGSIHAGDTAAAQAEAALTVAYNDLAGRSVAPVSVAGNLGGSTLSPGLYKSTSSLEVSSGDLTLDAKGDSNAIFIFQIASTLNVTVGRKIILIGGAKASNIFWQVGTSATIGTDAVVKGTILADQSISVQTGASVDGRLLARIGAVTLQSNTITISGN